jgi:hypothetical protein
MSKYPLTGDYQIVTHTKWTVEFNYVDSNGAIRSLVGFNATLQARGETEDAGTLFTLTSSPAAGLVVDGAAGKVTATLTKAQTAALEPQLFNYSLLIDDGTGPIPMIPPDVGVIVRGVVQ